MKTAGIFLLRDGAGGSSKQGQRVKGLKNEASWSRKAKMQLTHMRMQSLKSCSMPHEATVYLDLPQSFTLKAHDGACALLTGN